MYEVIVNYASAEADNAVVREGIIAFNESIFGLYRCIVGHRKSSKTRIRR
jgi:hypothetical protein